MPEEEMSNLVSNKIIILKDLAMWELLVWGKILSVLGSQRRSHRENPPTDLNGDREQRPEVGTAQTKT